MTTWYALIDGLIRAVRMRNAEHDHQMAAVFEQQIDSHEVLENIIDILPEKLKHTADSDLGDPTVMSPSEVSEWLKTIKVS